MAGRNTEKISFAIDPELFEKFQFFAWENGISMAEAYRDALNLYAEINMPDPEERAQDEALLAQVRAERQRQEAMTALPQVLRASVALPN